MTLKDRAEQAWSNYEYREGDLYSNCFKDGFEQGAKIVEEFAKNFYRWTHVCKKKGRPYDFDNVHELLKTFKEEE